MISVAERTSAALRRWSCVVEGDELRGGMSVVIPVRSDDGTALMLKLVDREVAATEATALRAFPASASVRCLDHADDLGALLLERLSTRSLVGVGDLDERIVVQARLARRLAVPDPGGLPWLADTSGWLAQLADQLQRDPELLSRRAADAARETIMELAHDPTTTLTHGDLHAANVHQDAEGAWRALDPRPSVGTVAFESHTVVLERDGLEDGTAPDAHELARRIALFAATAGVDPEWSSRLCQARAVSSALHEQLHGKVRLAGGLRRVAESLAS